MIFLSVNSNLSLSTLYHAFFKHYHFFSAFDKILIILCFIKSAKGLLKQ